jgi:hypothetical protein
MRWHLIALILLAAPLAAKEELVTLPARDTVQLTIYNSVDLTLVRETRELTFKQGNNRLQFSWANTLIDPTSVEIQALTNADQLEVLDTSYPAESHEMLIWTVSAEKALSARVEISYFTSGISWSAEYHGILTTDETQMTLTAFVSVSNHSGEEYDNASVRLVVGSINLVETIAGLAGETRKEKLGNAYREMRRADAAKSSADKKDIVKEGLSEYYIYSVEGHETIPNGWAKRLESFSQPQVPIRTVYTYDPNKYGAALTRLLTFKNNEEHKLGKEPLPAGVVRLYKSHGDNRLGYVGVVATDYIAKNDEIKVNTGPDQEVTMKLKRTSFKKENLVFQWNNNRQYIAGWDTVEEFTLELANFRGRAFDFEINLAFNGDFDFTSEVTNTKVDFRTQRFALTLQAGAKNEVKYTVRTRYGTNIRNK